LIGKVIPKEMGMTRLLPATAVLVGLTASLAQAQQDPLTLQLKWLPQAQFAGYYVAQDKGFYKDAGLAVTVKPGGPDIDPSQVIAEGGADVAVDWMPSALAIRERGAPLVNIAQLFQRSGMALVCRKDAGIGTPQDLKGRTLAVWFAGNEYPFLAWMDRLGYRTGGGSGDAGVKVLKQGASIDPLLHKQADCISAMTYNEYWQVIDAGLAPDQLVTFKYEEEGVATLEDGLYTLEKNLNDAPMADRLTRFLRASIKGWDYAVQNQAEAVRIVLANDVASGALTEAHQTRMMREIAKLVEGSSKGTGNLDSAAYERTVRILLAAHSDPISKRPENAWTHTVWEAAVK
jgi:NitT/TauT family transport system substrate-binding protein